MYAIIIGCGRTGSLLAMELLGEGHNLAIIDNSDENLTLLGSGFNGQRIRGIEYDTDVLLEAGIENADVFFAMTPDDNINLTAAQIAKNIYSVPRVIARIYDQGKKFMYEKLGIQTVNPVELGVDMLRESLSQGRLETLYRLGDLDVVQLRLTRNKLKSLEDFEDEFSCIVSAVRKNNVWKIPEKRMVLQSDDMIICAIPRDKKDKVMSLLSKEAFI